MSRYNDPEILARAHQLGGRIRKAIREAKRYEAEERNARTRPERRRAARRPTP